MPKAALTDHLIRTAPAREGSFYVHDTTQPGLALRVRPSGAKTFVVAYTHAGRLRWFTLDRYPAIGLSEARQAARIVRAKAALGGDPQGDKVSQRVGDTLALVHGRYLENAKENKSWEQPYKLLHRYVLPDLGNRKIKNISRADMWKLFDGLSDRPVLANQVLASASAVLSFAVKRNIISTNPCAGIERNKTTTATRFLNNDEIRTVWGLFDDLGPYQSSALRLVLLTAQRPGEVCSMRWEHVDLQNGLWTLPGEQTKLWPGTKNKRDHEVPLTASVLELLAELEPHVDGFVFPSNRATKAIPIPTVIPIWKQAQILRFRPHDLRATAATGMDALGISRQHISLVLNHTEGGVTAGYVRHDQRKHKLAALEAWSTELLRILGGTGKTDRNAQVISIRA